jgi:hypothetical protein
MDHISEPHGSNDTLGDFLHRISPWQRQPAERDEYFRNRILGIPPSPEGSISADPNYFVGHHDSTQATYRRQYEEAMRRSVSSLRNQLERENREQTSLNWAIDETNIVHTTQSDRQFADLSLETLEYARSLMQSNQSVNTAPNWRSSQIVSAENIGIGIMAPHDIAIANNSNSAYAPVDYHSGQMGLKVKMVKLGNRTFYLTVDECENVIISEAVGDVDKILYSEPKNETIMSASIERIVKKYTED